MQTSFLRSCVPRRSWVKPLHYCNLFFLMCVLNPGKTLGVPDVATAFCVFFSCMAWFWNLNYTDCWPRPRCNCPISFRWIWSAGLSQICLCKALGTSWEVVQASGRRVSWSEVLAKLCCSDTTFHQPHWVWQRCCVACWILRQNLRTLLPCF